MTRDTEPEPEVDSRGRMHAGNRQPRGDGDFDWDERYSQAEQMWSGEPNTSLVSEVRGIKPGIALDVGCGEGADAIWLAELGWQVTAIDVSEVALHRARAAAERMDVEVEWVHAGLLEATLPPGRFNLVSAQYPALLRTRQTMPSARCFQPSPLTATFSLFITPMLMSKRRGHTVLTRTTTCLLRMWRRCSTVIERCSSMNGGRGSCSPVPGPAIPMTSSSTPSGSDKSARGARSGNAVDSAPFASPVGMLSTRS
jgi:hypothetical protein